MSAPDKSKGVEHPTPNDQRSNVMNPNNPDHKANQDNRANQLNPNNPAHPSRPNDGKRGG